MEVEWVMQLPEGLDRSVINSVIMKLLKIDSADTRYSDCDICDAMGEVFFRMGTDLSRSISQQLIYWTNGFVLSGD